MTTSLAVRRAASRRAGIALLGLAAAVLVAFLGTLMAGSTPLSALEVLGSVAGFGDDPAVDFIIGELRLPTALAGLTVGAAFGMSGIVFQRLFDNPLASPDFVGVTSGASLAAVSALVLAPATVLVPVAAVAGAVVSTVTIYLLAWRDGITGYRFILIGIGVSTLLFSVTSWVIAMADITDARAAMTWLVGSVGFAGAVETRVLVGLLVVAIPVALVLERQMRTLELGRDAAVALGARVERSRAVLLVVSVVMIGAGTAVAGPLAFVALMAGPIARRLLGPAPGVVLAAALAGSAMVMGADLVARFALPVSLPTGVVTGAIGAPYLCWLLITANREGRGG